MAEVGKLPVSLSHIYIYPTPLYNLLFRIVFTSWATSHLMNTGVINFLAWSITENTVDWIFAASSYLPMVWCCYLFERSNALWPVVPCSGALGSWSAALLAPYSDKPDSSGLMLSSPEILETLVRQFWKDGWQTVRHLFSLSGID